MNFRRRLLCGLVAAAVCFVSGCRKTGENSAAAQPAVNAVSAPVAAGPPERHHHMFMSGVSPLIVSMSPETITVRDGHAPMTRYSLTYEITNSEKVKKAYISVRAVGVGEVQRFEVDVQPRATIEFLLDASRIDLGPTVRFRANCPNGVTDWFIMGSNSLESQPNLSSRQIGNVSPSYVEMGRGQAGGLPIEIWGSQITRECTPEAQVDGTAAELANVVAGDKKISGLLSYSDLQGRPVVARHLEVNLVVYSLGYKEPTRQVTPMGVYIIASSEGTAEDTFNLNFVEQ
jgi:hypothetical protein